jgi:primosomal protein N' (replication factor Y)
MSTSDPSAPGVRAVAHVVILPAAGDAGVLDYAVPEAMQPLVEAGMRVLVPLGRRQAVGIIVATATHSSFPKLRALLSLLDERPVLDADALRLCRWMADYYLCTLGEAITAALPGSVRMTLDRVVRALPAGSDGEPRRLTPGQQALLDALEANGEVTVEALQRQLGAGAAAAITSLRKRGLVAVEQRLRGGAEQFTRLRRFYRIRKRLSPQEATEWERKRPKRYEIYRYLAQHPLGRAPASELHGSFDNLTAHLRSLQKEGLVGVETEEFYRPVLPEDAPSDRKVRLNPEQNISVAAIVGSEGFRSFLLWGVTGSGKTEVYLNAIGDVLAKNGTALVLVPEISLTHQVVDRVRARFGEGVAILHSGLSDGERWDEWRRISRGEVGVVVGARSAVFAPLPRLGLIIVDEEHDPSYKQDDGIRYNGRDVAVVRARLAGCAAVLGSATPSMETFHNTKLGRYTLLRLSERVEARPLPAVEIVDMRRNAAAGRAVALSPRLIAALEANITAQAQSLLFLNRRGFSNFLQCHQCGEPLTCPNCSVTLTLHRAITALRCHHCDYTIPVPAACPGCGGLSLGAWGAGTEQVEAALQEILPRARIARMDRDTTSRKGAHREILAAWERREYDVLIGTQMVTKGHDVHSVTLVGVLMADLSLNFPDFRASERTFQLVAQVAGRAGRGERPGRVVVQTFQPEHESLKCAEHHDFATFAEIELGHRQELLYPPYSRMALLRCEGESLEATERIANAMRAAAAEMGQTPGAGVMITGPAPAPLEKIRRRHRWQLLLRAPSGAAVRRAARYARDRVAKEARAGDIRVIIDIDPYSML